MRKRHGPCVSTSQLSPSKTLPLLLISTDHKTALMLIAIEADPYQLCGHQRTRYLLFLVLPIDFELNQVNMHQEFCHEGKQGEKCERKLLVVLAPANVIQTDRYQHGDSLSWSQLLLLLIR